MTRLFDRRYYARAYSIDQLRRRLADACQHNETAITTRQGLVDVHVVQEIKAAVKMKEGGR
jgi:hypothetical protein